IMAADPRKRKLVGLGPEQETEPQGDRGPAGRFVEGSILRITMHNFLTYDHCEVYPGPNLNMIIGANGTGKSSIVCAICLGLAGKTATLGRGDKVGAQMRLTCNVLTCCLRLQCSCCRYRAVGNLVIFREMQVQNNQSTWTINGEHASQRVVEEAVKALRIQVGNLCQFLPQEKVGEFAKMSKVELLEATEKSVGPPEMYEIHCELKTFRSKERELEVIRETQLRIIYTAEEKYHVKKSQYSNKTIASNSVLRPSQFLNLAVEADKRNRLWEQLKAVEQNVTAIDAQIKTLQEQQSQLDRRDNELLRRKKMLSEMKGKKRQLEQKISAKQDSLIQMEQSGIDLRQAEQEACTKTRAVNSQKVAIVTEFGQHMRSRVKLHMVKVYLALEIVELSAEKARLESSCREATQKCKQLDETKTALLNTCHERLKKAKETCNIDPRENGIPEELKTAFSELPNTLDEIDAWLNEERSRAECFTGLSSGVVEEYTRRSQEIENLSRELEEKHSALETYQQNISQAKEQWLNPLRLLVEQINEKFSDFFYSMQCAGEVDLHSENEEEYDRYGIRIRVKFRSSTQLHELTPHHQSGGERSVSTMLYLMALQELNRCPFRVVDEINQGMDPVNERRVFDIVVRTACSGTTSQYFFITPKLLPNLQYADEMTVLCVHNGPQMLAPTKWNEKAFLRRARRRQTRAANA
uniref:Structural maintenance of chromosomes protein 5 n=1 Tax=Scleropages formosus TaxID=113540 RepID=A0A8C9VY44_SCLFO